VNPSAFACPTLAPASTKRLTISEFFPLMGPEGEQATSKGVQPSLSYVKTLAPWVSYEV
jgi:hypothetical protein